MLCTRAESFMSFRRAWVCRECCNLQRRHGHMWQFSIWLYHSPLKMLERNGWNISEVKALTLAILL